MNVQPLIPANQRLFFLHRHLYNTAYKRSIMPLAVESL
jgi:hypothetical protein